MKKIVRLLVSCVAAVALCAGSSPFAAAQSVSSLPGSSSADGVDQTEVASPPSTPVGTGEGPFAAYGLPTPPGAEGYEVNQASDKELHPEGVPDWEPTQDPNNEVVAGQMRSDREEIPEGFSREDADRAEVREAELTDEATATLNARAGCGVYWPSWFEVCGAIKTKYDSVGGPTSFLNLPKSREITNPDGVGKRSEFVNGFIYWHPTTGAHTVSIPVSKVMQRHGWEQGFLGYPTTSDMDLGAGWFRQDFQGGHVYTRNAVPASQASIQGAIFDKWQSLGAQNSELGYPISDELATPDGVGRYNVFEGGMIYWHPQYGAHSVTSATGAVWAASGYELSEYGFPTSEQYLDGEANVRQNFSRKSMNLSDYFTSNELVEIGGELLNKDLVEMLKWVLGRDLANTENSEGFASLQAQQWDPPQNSNWSKGTHTYYVNSPVGIPGNYVYNPGGPDRTLHDFCSYSRDIWGENTPANETDTLADFRGPCAIHDICYAEDKDYDSRVVTCDPNLRNNLKGTCNSTYITRDKVANRECNATADLMYSGVKNAQAIKN